MKTCSDLGCENKYYGRGYCRNHYYQYVWNPANIDKKRHSCREHYYRNHDKMKKRAKDNYYNRDGKTKSLQTYYKYRDKRLLEGRSPEMRKYKSNHHLRIYGITLEKKEEMIKRQNGVCLICGNGFKNNSDKQLDHCHITGLIRGILCGRCNRGLGQFNDNIDILKNAIEYIMRFNKEETE